MKYELKELRSLMSREQKFFLYLFKIISLQLQGRLEKLIIEQDTKISRQVEALEESIGLKSGAKSPAGKKRK